MAAATRFSTRLLLSCAAIGAAGGLVVAALNWGLLLLPQTWFAYSLYAVTLGVWGLAALVAVALFRAPGVGLLTMVFAGVVNLVTPNGFAMLVNFLLAGLIIELPFLVTRYRRWSDGYVRSASIVALVLASTAYLGTLVVSRNVDGSPFLPPEFYPWGVVAVVAGAALVATGVTLLAQGVARALERQGLGRRSTDTVLVTDEA